jgi:hypothetical protein
VDDVVPPASAEKVEQYAGPEDKWRQDPPSPACVQVHSRPDGNDLDPRNPGIGTALPLSKGQIRNLVTVADETLGKVPVPTLGAADRVRVEAVVDDANAHGSVSL